MSEPRTPYYPVSLRPGADLDEQLATRGDSPGATMKRDLMRYYRTCAAELARMDFTLLEVNVLYELYADVDADAMLAGPLWAILTDAMDTNRVRSWHHLDDREAFVAKLRALSPGGTIAIVDALERLVRYRVHIQGRLELETCYQDVGLMRKPRPLATATAEPPRRLRRARDEAAPRAASDRLRRRQS